MRIHDFDPIRVKLHIFAYVFVFNKDTASLSLNNAIAQVVHFASKLSF